MDYGHITLGPNYFYINVHLAIVSVILVIVISVNMIASPYTLLIMRVYSVTVIEKVRIVTILYSVCTGISFKQRYVVVLYGLTIFIIVILHGLYV